ncbi:MAG: PSD1 and planctomycete cytochrome C domain-containing protein [Planctomycetota bacterium]
MRKPWLTVILTLCAAVAARADDGFERHVRPLLAERCLGCHGPKKQQGGLRLDTREGAMKGGDAGPVIVPGKPAESRLLAVLAPDAEPRMPPGKPLAAGEIRSLEEWIARGAPWPAERASTTMIGDPWGLKPLAERPVPGDPARAIDAFINARLKAEGLVASPRADRRTLLRRAAFVVTGMPPRPESVEAFLADTRPGAWDRALDHLFSGPAHGERWARHWLDVARYADTKGYVFFQDGSFPWSWAYRDWVARAFNADLPYDRFVRAQLAADRLQGGECGPADLPALGFLTLGGRFMNNQHDIIDDRIDVVTRGLLGLTVSCARCHDHKFDPVPSRDYYSLHSVFASSVEPEVPPLFSPEPSTDEYGCFREELESRGRALAEFIDGKHEKLLGAARGRLADHLVAVARLRGKPPQDDFMLLADPDDPNPTLLKRWRAWLDAPARRTDTAWRLWLAIEGKGPDAFPGEIMTLLSTEAARGGAPSPIIEAFKARQPRSLPEAAAAYASAFAAPNRMRDAAVARSWDDPASPWNTTATAFSDLELLPDRAAQGVLKQLRSSVEQWRVSGPAAPPRAHALVDAPEPVDGRVFLRGNPLRPGEAAPREVPASLGNRAPVRAGSGRLELARAITSPGHPLLGRVWVNRVWQICFGEGLSRTPGDFGSRGDLPSHPELLDHLAIALSRDGWSTRRLLRAILASDAWQRSGEATAEARAKDPDNRLLARRDPRRLDFEALRDSMLFVSGRLDPSSGGPSARDLNSPRRAIYLHIDRLQVPGLLRQFDFPSPDSAAPRRDITTTPLQALWLMNHPFGIACADALAKRAGDPANPSAWTASLYRIALQGTPTAEEAGLMESFLKSAGPDGPRQAAQALLAGNAFSFAD